MINTVAKILNKILPKRIQQHMKNIVRHDQVGFVHGMQGCIHKYISIKVMHHINRIKYFLKFYDHINRSEKAFGKTTSCHDKNPWQIGYRRNISQHNKGHGQ